MEQEPFEMTGKTLFGLESVLAEELREIGVENITVGKRMVSFRGDNRALYRANFCCRTAIRILKPVANFKARDADTVYNEVKNIEWDKYISHNKTFTIDAVIYSESFNHSKYVAYRTKDAIADYFNEKYGKRPSVSVKNPDYYINIHISHDDCTVSLDSSGESLHRRGYRVSQGEAPLSEVLAAGMILKTGWRGESNFIDPFCGSGTLLIEAAMIALNIAPGVYRKEYAFERWQDFDKELFEEIYNDESGERNFDFKCFGSDISPKSVENARNNVKSAGLSKYIELEIKPFQQYAKAPDNGILVTNPPYGERISTDDIFEMYGMIGERLKHVFTGYDAWILSYKDEYFEKIGLKPKHKIKLMNGELECEYRCYELFEGKNEEFKKARYEGLQDDKQRTQDIKPEIQNAKQRTRDGKYGTRDGNPEIRDAKRRIRDAKFGTRDGKPQTRDGKFGTRDGKPQTRDGKFGTRDRKFGTRDAKFGTRDGKPQTRDGKFGTRDRKFGTRDGKPFTPFPNEEKELQQNRSERHNRLAARHKGIIEKEQRAGKGKEDRQSRFSTPTQRRKQSVNQESGRKRKEPGSFRNKPLKKRDED